MSVVNEFVIPAWGVGGVMAIVGHAVVSLTPIALEPIREGGLTPGHWAVLFVWIIANAYAEGVRGFHRKFSPRVVDRALFLGRHPSVGRVLFAPAFCMGLFHASKRTKIVSWTLVVVIFLLVVVVRRIAQPWRGIIDAGVVVGLGLGLLSMCWLFVHAVVTKREPVLHELES